LRRHILEGIARLPLSFSSKISDLRLSTRHHSVPDSRHLTGLSRIALLVAGGDLLTKAAAKAFLAEDPTFFSNWLQFAVVHNDGGAFGWSAGVYTWQLNLAITLAAIVFMIPVTRDLSRVDRSAPAALGLIVGGALGNLASLLTSPDGVVDFIVVHYSRNSGVVLNVADAAAYAGLAMILRTGFLITLAIRRNVDVFDIARKGTVLSLFAEKAAAKRALRGGERATRPLRPEHEVAIVDWSEVSRSVVSLADAPSAEIDGVIDIGTARRSRRLGTDASSRRPLGTESLESSERTR
jgi:lipoprotein signal peptidase